MIEGQLSTLTKIILFFHKKKFTFNIFPQKIHDLQVYYDIIIWRYLVGFYSDCKLNFTITMKGFQTAQLHNFHNKLISKFEGLFS
jgi:hypothetical protein